MSDTLNFKGKTEEKARKKKRENLPRPKDFSHYTIIMIIVPFSPFFWNTKMHFISCISSYLHLKVLLRLSVGGLRPWHEFNRFLVAMWELICSNFFYCHQLKIQIHTLTHFLKFNEKKRKIRMGCSSNIYNFLMILNNLWTQILPVCIYTPVNIIWKKCMWTFIYKHFGIIKSDWGWLGML